MEIIAIISIITGVGALVISILTHIKRSNCSSNGFEVITSESPRPAITNNPKITFI